MRDRRIAAVLAGLVLLDGGLSLAGFFAPDLWFEIFHGAPRVDPQGLLPRAAASWVAFFVVQLIALVRHRSDRRWIAVVAGLRLGDVLTDVTCLSFAASKTLAAWALFPIAGAGNLVIGAWLLRQAGR